MISLSLNARITLVSLGWNRWPNLSSVFRVSNLLVYIDWRLVCPNPWKTGSKPWLYVLFYCHSYWQSTSFFKFQVLFHVQYRWNNFRAGQLVIACLNHCTVKNRVFSLKALFFSVDAQILWAYTQPWFYCTKWVRYEIKMILSLTHLIRCTITRYFFYNVASNMPVSGDLER